MEESTTYQKLRQQGLDEGRVLGGRRFLLHVGAGKLGEPDALTASAIEAIKDFDRLEYLALRLLDEDVRNWEDLLRNP